MQPSEPTAQQQHAASSVRSGKQTLDYTALCACVKELQAQWVPSKVEEVRCSVCKCWTACGPRIVTYTERRLRKWSHLLFQVLSTH